LSVVSRRGTLGVAALLAVGASFACSSDTSSRVVRLATTTSVYDTGLMDTLVVAFSRAHPDHSVRVVAVGTGQALALGERKDADVVLVHATEREIGFVADGQGLRRTTLMRNDFVIAGPESDAAAVTEAVNGPRALVRILEAGAGFASRGDDSGTHIREQSLWEEAGRVPEGDWYHELGQGMGATLMFASETDAYVLTDRATLTVLRKNGVELTELYSGGRALDNVYSLIPVADAPGLEGALVFETWMKSESARAIVRDFGRQDFGAPLFELISR
jgi:tungstate transport system substrate-binding protein